MCQGLDRCWCPTKLCCSHAITHNCARSRTTDSLSVCDDEYDSFYASAPAPTAAAALATARACIAWMDVTQMVLTMSGTVHPRLKSLTGLVSPCNDKQAAHTCQLSHTTGR